MIDSKEFESDEFEDIVQEDINARDQHQQDVFNVHGGCTSIQSLNITEEVRVSEKIRWPLRRAL